MNKLMFSALILFAFLFIKCNSDDSDNPTESSNKKSSIEGTWRDSTSTENETFVAKLDLTEENGVVNGTGNIVFYRHADANSVKFEYLNTAIGAYAEPTLTVNVNQGSNTYNYIGTLNSDKTTISGTAIYTIAGIPFMPDSVYTVQMTLKKQ